MGLLHMAYFQVSVGNLSVGFIGDGVGADLVLSGFLVDGGDGANHLVVFLLEKGGFVIGICQSF